MAANLPAPNSGAPSVAPIDYFALADKARQMDAPSTPPASPDYFALADQARKQAGNTAADPTRPAIRSTRPQVMAREQTAPPVTEADLAALPPGGGQSGLGPVVGGLTRAAAGVKSLFTGKSLAGEPMPAARSGREIVGGALEAATPLVAGSVVARPIASAVGMGVGTGVQAGVQAGGQALGMSPDAAGLAGDVAGIASGVATAKAPNLLRTDPQVAITRALRPPPSDSGFAERIPQTLELVKGANPGFAPAVDNGKLNLADAANKAIKVHQNALQPWLDRAAGQTISGDPIVKATADATRGMLPSEQGNAQSLIARAQQDYQSFTPEQLRARLALLNERLSPFYKKSAAVQSSMLADIPESVLKAQRDAVADTLYRALDPEGEGLGPRLIQSNTGDLIHLRDSALARQNAILAEQPLTPLGKIVDPAKAAIRAVLPGKATGSGIAFAEGSEGRSLPLLKRAFAATDDTAGANAIRNLPKPGPRQIAAPADTSGPLPPGVADFRSAGAPNPLPQQRLLPAATSPIGVSGTVAPDITGNAAQAARRMNAGPRQLPAATSGIGVSGTSVPDIVARGQRGTGQALLPPPAPGQPPLNILPRGPGAIGPAGTVPLRSTETARPMPAVSGDPNYPGYVAAPEPQTPPPAAAPPIVAAPSPIAPRVNGAPRPVIPQPEPAPEPVMVKPGAPYNQDTAPLPGPVGNKATVYTPSDMKMDTQYRVVPLDSLKTSFGGDYPPELQPRNTDRIGSRQRIADLKNNLNNDKMGESVNAGDGAPITLRNGAVVTRNHGTEALSQLYAENNPKAAAYQQWLAQNAQRFGVDPADVQGIDKPVLVREIQGDHKLSDLQRFAEDANESTTARMSDAERASMLSKRMTGSVMDAFTPREDGTPNPEFIQAVLKGLPNTEQAAFMDKYGQPSQAGIRMIKNAVFAKAYPDTAAIERMSESTDDAVKNVTNGMLGAAPRMARIQEEIAKGNLHDLGLHQEASDAANALEAMRSQGLTLDHWLRQQSMFGRDPAVEGLVKIFSEHGRSAKAISDVLGNYADLVEHLGDPKQAGMFGQGVQPTKLELLEAANARVKETIAERKAANTNRSLFQANEASSGSGAAPGIAGPGPQTPGYPGYVAAPGE